MKDLFDVDFVTWAFGVFNVLRLASYVPQIVAVVRDRNGATAISFSCWSIWVGANASTAIYAWAKLHDANLALISGFNALCCGVILVLAIYKRASHHISPSETFAPPTHAATSPDGDALNSASR